MIGSFDQIGRQISRGEAGEAKGSSWDVVEVLGDGREFRLNRGTTREAGNSHSLLAPRSITWITLQGCMTRH